MSDLKKKLHEKVEELKVKETELSAFWEKYEKLLGSSSNESSQHLKDLEETWT